MAKSGLVLIVLVLAVAAIIMSQLADIQRYLKMRSM